MQRIAGALLARHGCKPGDRVALAMENCPEYFPLLYGIWRAGLSAVPMNNKLHAKEMAWILADSDSRLCIASPKLADGLSAPDLKGLPPIVVTGTADTRALLAGDPVRRAPSEPAGRSLAVLHQRHHGPAQGRHAHPSQPAVRLPLLLRRHRLHRHARHDPARRAADARLRASTASPTSPAAPTTSSWKARSSPSACSPRSATYANVACSRRQPWSRA